MGPTSIGLLHCSSDASSTSPLTEPSTADAGDAAADRDASVDAAEDRSTTPDAALPALGNCAFTVDGASYQSAAGDLFTTAIFKDGAVTIQCVAAVGPTRFTINVGANGVTGPGAFTGLGQYSEQPATGGTATQYRSFTAPLTLARADGDVVGGTSQFSASGTDATSKAITVAFQLANKK